MNAQEAISSLSKLKKDKQEKEQFNTSKTFAESLTGLKNILVDTMVGLTKIIIGNQYPVTVKNFPKPVKNQEVTVTNFPKPELRKEIEKVEVVNQPKIEFSTAGTDTILKRLESQGNIVAPLIKSFVLGHSEQRTSFKKSVDDVLSAIKKIKLDPQITVMAPEVKVDAPIINIPKTEPVKFPKSIKVSNLDLTETVNKLEEVITELQYNGKQSVTVNNPGDFPVATFNSKPIVDAIEAIPTVDTSLLATSTNQTLILNKIDQFNTNDIEVASSTVTYIGTEDKDGAYLIKKIDTTSGVVFGYATIANNAGYTTYTTAWVARAVLTYQNFKEAF